MGLMFGRFHFFMYLCDKIDKIIQLKNLELSEEKL